jgi:predicted dehydrogenase
MTGTRCQTRREFLKCSAVFGGVMILPGRVLGQGGAPSANDRLRMAGIGVGGQGWSDLRACRGEDVVALADVDDRMVGEAVQAFPGARRFKDYREMFDRMADEIDAVVVATPDHNHFAAAMHAIKAGKHVYVEKPLCPTIWEIRTLHRAAREAGVITQMGNQGHSLEGMRLIKEWIDAGVIGKVTRVDMWTDRPFTPMWFDQAFPAELPEPGPVPPELDWNLWLGPAPERPYSPAYVPRRWRGWWGFGTGALGDIGCHTFDAPFWALNLGTRCTVRADIAHVGDHFIPRGATVTYEFPARGELPPVTLTWYEGRTNQVPRPPQLEADRELSAEGGALFYGDRGTLYSPGMRPNSPRLIPESAMQEFAATRPAPTLPRVEGGHMGDFLAGCKEGRQPSSTFDYAAPLTELVMLGNLAMRTRKPIDWDPDAMAATGVPEAAPFIRPPMRDGWAV